MYFHVYMYVCIYSQYRDRYKYIIAIEFNISGVIPLINFESHDYTYMERHVRKKNQ